MRKPLLRSFFLSSLAALPGLLAAAQAPPPKPPVLPFAEVRPGLVGTGYTVLAGEALTPFTAEVLGTVEQGAALPRMIVCRLKGGDLENLGLLAAMSGSPVYVEGRFLGAVSSSWPFAKAPLCGVTPAEDMLAIPSAAGPGQGAASGARTLDASAFLDAVSKPPAIGLAAGGSPWPGHAPPEVVERLNLMGFSWSHAGADAGSAPAGPSPQAAPPGPGGMIGLQLISGDVQYTAFGTVSWEDGGRFLAFGHPFMGLGATQIPVVGAKVVTAVPSLFTGFKLCTPAQPLGTATEDRPAGIYGRFGQRADTLPVEVRFTGSRERTFRFETVKHSQLSPMLVAGAAAALYGTLEDQIAPKTVTLKDFAIKPSGLPEVRLRDQVFASQGAFLGAAEYVMAAVDLLLNNPHEAVPVESLRFTAQVASGNGTETVDAAWLDADAVRAGEPLNLTVRLQPFQGQAHTVTCAVPTEGFPPGEVTLLVGGTFSLMKALAATATDLPRDGAGYIRFLREIPGGESVTVAAVAQDQATVLSSKRLGTLPPSVRSLLGSQPTATSASASAQRLLWRTEAAAHGAVTGQVELTFTVKERGDSDERK